MYPEAKTNKGKQKASKEGMPSHLTSDQFIQLCEEKKRKTKEEEDEKARKKNRERKRLNKENGSRRKGQNKMAESRGASQKESRRGKEKRKLQMERKRQSHRQEQKNVQFTSDGSEVPLSAPSTSSVPKTNVLTPPKVKRRKITSFPCCALCGAPEGSSDSEEYWKQCSNCDRWYEETCAEVNLEDVQDIEWFCDICIDI